jgi:polyisoprenoid-binding protein YceI
MLGEFDMLRRLAIATTAFLLFAAPSFGQEVKLNKEKSKIDFLGKKADGKHAGGFKDFSADAKVNWESPEKSTLTIEIKTDSLWSDDAKLTDHLKNPDFFDVKKFGTIKFESTKIESGETEGKITGKLTMLGKTGEITVPTKVEVADGALIIKAEFKVTRSKWGMTYGIPKVNDDVEITATLHYDR